MKILEISSASNEYFRKALSLTSSKGIKSENQALISGKRIVQELVENPTFQSQIGEIIFDEPLREIAMELAQRHSISRLVSCARPLFKELDEMGTHFPLITMNLPAQTEYIKPKVGLNVFLALSDPLNLGATLRSLEAFEADQIVLLKECANPYLPKSIKTSSGSALRVPLVFGPSIKDLILEKGIGLDGKGQPLSQHQWQKETCLVLGEEGLGIPSPLKENLELLSIPMNSKVESLNAMVALSIACYSYYSSQKNLIQ